MSERYTRYCVKLTFDYILIEADLTQARSVVRIVVDDEGDEYYNHLPLTTAECRHDERQMAKLVLSLCGQAYWLNPDDVLDVEDSDAVDQYLERLILSIAVV